MNTEWQHLSVVLEPLVIFIVAVLVGYLIRQILFRKLAQWSQKTSSKLDDIIIDAIYRPFMIWTVMVAVNVALHFSTLAEKYILVADKIILILGIISVTLVLNNLASGIIKVYASRIDSALPVTSLTQNITRIIIFVVGVLVVLNSLGISITPILATLGVGGLAVALALQDTLSNLFAGFHVIVSRQIRIGDYIKLETGQEGYVIDINWRMTKIRISTNSVVLVPNTKLAQTIITNYYLPDRELVVPIELCVHYNSDLKKVERVTLEVAKDVLKNVEGGVAEFDPVVRMHTLGDSGINCTVVLRAKEHKDQAILKHEFILRVHERFKQEGIMIPYPTRTIEIIPPVIK